MTCSISCEQAYREVIVAYSRLCGLDDLKVGEMREFEHEGHQILVVWPDDSEPRAFQALCLHEGIPLIDGDFDGAVLTCAAHSWDFDAKTGENLMPGAGCLAVYPLRIDGNDVQVDVAAMLPARKD
ncbi:Rieske 2Fe-2S domain-containing protein [Pseudorhodoplanes sp.]|uniref:Rieske 2Fe-2S domain-containing protein n=1 Tax=Pseudorhodoplanes sp. TaxID=1934341 RepID=UPI002C64C0A9|nr:Rieske 2Fe-2S domain-containing protein [Pseudorhodoplanes sp.]HWV55497.1 Rieske 2Fe-2S domain-containing protein [Pseudorhodoplanes sp.]